MTIIIFITQIHQSKIQIQIQIRLKQLKRKKDKKKLEKVKPSMKSLQLHLSHIWEVRLL